MARPQGIGAAIAGSPGSTWRPRPRRARGANGLSYPPIRAAVSNAAEEIDRADRRQFEGRGGRRRGPAGPPRCGSPRRPDTRPPRAPSSPRPTAKARVRPSTVSATGCCWSRYSRRPVGQQAGGLEAVQRPSIAAVPPRPPAAPRGGLSAAKAGASRYGTHVGQPVAAEDVGRLGHHSSSASSRAASSGPAASFSGPPAPRGRWRARPPAAGSASTASSGTTPPPPRLLQLDHGLDSGPRPKGREAGPPGPSIRFGVADLVPAGRHDGVHSCRASGSRPLRSARFIKATEPNSSPRA